MPNAASQSTGKICKVISYILLAAALLSLFMNCITLNPQYKSVLGLFGGKLNVRDAADELLDWLDVDLDDSPAGRKIYAKATDTINYFLDDYAFSLLELGKGSGNISYLTGEAMKELGKDEYFAREVKDLASVKKQTKTASTAISVFVIAVCASVLLSVILRLTCRKDLSLLTCVLGIALTVGVIIAVNKVNSSIDQSISFVPIRNMFSVTPWPFALAGCSLLSFVFWLIGAKNARRVVAPAFATPGTNFVPQAYYPAPAAAPVSAAEKAFCPSCGAKLAAGAAFCASCGTAVRQQAASALPEYVHIFCQNCGTQLRVPAHAGKVLITCPKCGTKMETEIK